MSTDGAILAIDVGAGTQDILLYEAGKPVENCVQLILPSPTVILAQRVRAATREGLPLCLTGNTMGGGPVTWAVREHLSAGHPVYATPEAAATLHDSLAEVERLGVRIVDEPPSDCHALRLYDVDLPTLAASLAPYGVELPESVAVAVQDHGYAPTTSNRLFRFHHWRRFVEEGGDIADLLYEDPPAYLTRMQAVQRDAPGAYVMDTGAAAIWGALCDEAVAARREEGVVIVNVGNAHTIAVLLRGKKVEGLFEHHTGTINGAKLDGYLAKLRAGTLTHDEIFADGGHGAYISPGYERSDGFAFVAVTGPNRQLAAGKGHHFAVPYGDMMLAGCFGLVFAVLARLGLSRG
ncbi:MAG: DUF1786 domain-containing protein [Chloroflexota bacterium]